MMRRDVKRSERGAVAVEFALTVPILLIVVFAGLNIGLALSARSRIADAAGFAARAESIAARGRPGGQVIAEEIVGMVNSRLADSGTCSGHETTYQVEGTLPYRYLRVQVTCTLRTVSNGLIPLALTTVSATAAMPIDFEPN